MVRSDHMTRRRFLTLYSGGAVAVLCGCTEIRNEPSYQEGEVNQTDSDQRTAEQMVAAEALAITQANENASPLESLTLEEHEFVVKDGYKGPTVQGVVSNTGTDLIKLAEIRVRVYDTDDAQLGRYLDRTGDINPGMTWQFEAILLDSAADIADYDITVLGISG